MSGFTQHFHTAPDGIRTAYRRYDAGQSGKLPVICLHGLTRNSRDFEEVSPRVATMGHTVIAVDVRGRGLSDRGAPPDSYNPEVYVNDVLGLLKSEGISKVISLGTSMGGIMTMILAAKRPELLAGALINDIGPELDPAGLDRIAGYVGRTTSAFENWHEAAEAIRAVNGDAFPDETGEDFWLAFARRTCRELESGRVELDYDPAIAEPFRQPDRALPPDMWPLYDALAPVPLVVVRGAISDLLSHESLKKMKARHPDFTGVEIPRVGHAPLLTEPPARAAIDGLLARVG